MKNKISNAIIRLDISGSWNFVKLVAWCGMAAAILLLSSDIQNEIISAITYFLGIIFDMIFLRKHNKKKDAVGLHLLSGILNSLFIVIIIINNSIGSLCVR